MTSTFVDDIQFTANDFYLKLNLEFSANGDCTFTFSGSPAPVPLTLTQSSVVSR